MNKVHRYVKNFKQKHYDFRGVRKIKGRSTYTPDRSDKYRQNKCKGGHVEKPERRCLGAKK